MAGKKIKTAKQKEKRFFSFFADMDPELKSILLKCAGVLVFLFTVFTFVAMFSYMFTWQPDKSLSSYPVLLHMSAEAHLLAGKLGYLWVRFLISGMFGLASYVFVFLLAVFSYRLFFWQRSIGLMRITFLSVSGAFLLALGLSLIGSPRLLDGGLGGDAGHAVMSWMANLVGPIVPVFLLVAAVVVWLLFASGRFAHWFAITGEKKPAVQDDDPVAQVDEVEDTEVVDEPDPQQDDVQVPVAEDDTQVEVVEDEPVAVVEDVPAPQPEDQSLEVIRGDVVTEIVEDLPRIDNREELERFEFPSLDLLKDYTEGVHEVSQAELDKNNLLIRNTLKNYKIEVEKVTAVVGPTVTLYKIVLAPGMRVASIEQVHREIAMALEVGGVRVVTLPGSVGIEVPNSTPSIVPLKSMLNDDSFRNSSAELPVAIGYSTLAQKVKTFDLSDAPHLLVAGATKQGKSVGLNVIISSLLYAKHPSELKFVFIDPKAVEFTSYNSLLKHYLAVLPVAGDEEEEKKNAIVKKAKQAEQVLHSLCIEMDARYDLLAKAGVNDFKLYNEKYKDRHLLPTDGHQFLPYLVVVIDEYADLIMAGGSSPEDRKSAKNIEAYIIRLAQKGRAAGIHVIIATQRPSVNVITGLIKANFPTRIAFRVLSGVDSRTILDAVGAENLIGKGDMLYYAGVKVERIQCALVSMAEINKITKFIGEQSGYRQSYSTPDYLPVPESQDGEPGGGYIDMQNIDSMFEEAARTVVISQKGSTSDLQR